MAAHGAPSFASLFKSNDAARDNYLSRVFGMFSEEPIRIWSRCGDAPYLDLGRPTIRRPGVPNGSTIDFALQSRASGKIYPAELKCELAYSQYRYLSLTSSDQVRRHVKENKEAFARFIDCARNAVAYDVFVRGSASPSKAQSWPGEV